MLGDHSIGTGLAILGTAEVSKDAVKRLLAPTADYIGAGILQGTKALVNTTRVLANAVKRLGTRIEGSGEIPSRVLREVLDQAPFCDDELVAEYLGGILATSFSDTSRDDRGVVLLATLRRLSTYAVRTHYICYREYCSLFSGHLTLKEVYEGELPNTAIADDTRVLATKKGYSDALELNDNEDYYEIYNHVARALSREDLMQFGVMGDGAFLSRSLKETENSNTYSIIEEGFVYDSTPAGDELFLWGLGQGAQGTSLDFALVDGAESLDISVPHVPDVEGFHRLSDRMQ